MANLSIRLRKSTMRMESKIRTERLAGELVCQQRISGMTRTPVAAIQVVTYMCAVRCAPFAFVNICIER